ncbi:MAG: Crp/Fnr family transcriptional regulator [Cellvibrio sp.]
MGISFVPSTEIFTHLAGSGLPAFSDLASATTQYQLRPGEALFRSAERQPYAFVINQGIIKLVYETPNGDLWIKGFAEAGICFASLTALQENGVTSFSAYAVTDAIVERIEYKKLQHLADQHIEWQRALTNAFKYYGQRKEQREMELLTLTPEERYLLFINKHPELVAVLRQVDIASYIRITPVALSRIRARIKTVLS